MLSVAKLTLGQEAYYEQQVAAGLDDYYAGRGESPGLWAGSGAGGLGLAGVVEDGDLGTLLRGVDPAGRERLRAPVRERTITVRTLDVESGEWRVEPKRLAPVSGYDLVFSCPKSVSLLHALTEDERVLRADRRGARLGVAGGPRLSRARGLRRPPRSRRRDPRARRWLRRGGVPAPDEPGAGPAPAHARDRREHGPHRGRRVAGARRRSDPEDVPACCRVPLRGPAQT